jgi:hypothetical protein
MIPLGKNTLTLFIIDYQEILFLNQDWELPKAYHYIV